MRFWHLNKLVDEMKKEIKSLRNEIELREEVIKNQNQEILKLQQRILNLEDDKKTLLNIEPLIQEKSNKKKESQ